MANKITQGLNVLPRISYRWLKVNELNFEEAVAMPLKPYNLDFLPPNVDPGLTLRKMEPGFGDQNPISTPFGVSRELVELGETNCNGGFNLLIREGTKLAEPLYFKYLFNEENDTVIDHNIIRAEKDSAVTIVVEYRADGDQPAYHNGVTKIFADQGAQVTLIKIQRLNDQSLHLDSHYIDANPYSNVRYLQVELGSNFAITNYLANLKENATATVDGMYLGDGERTLDLSYQMIHRGYRSTSDILVKGALKDRSRKIFRGTLDFRRGAHLSTGNEEESVLLLDPTVKSDAVPLLLSEEDDIQGGHAASAGKVDPDQLFYLMTRGLSEQEATQTVVKASFQPIIDELPSELRRNIQDNIKRRLVAENV
jgi:hypothetical protein